MTEKLLSYYKVKGFALLSVCFAVIFCRVMTFIRYIRVDFTFGVLHCVRYNKDSTSSLVKVATKSHEIARGKQAVSFCVRLSSSQADKSWSPR